MKGRQTGRYKKLCITDPDASMATDGRNRQLEPSYNYEQNAVVDIRIDEAPIVLAHAQWPP